MIPYFSLSNFFLPNSSFSTNFPFSFGQTQCSSRLLSPRQTTITSASDVSFICLETTHSSIDHYIPINNMIQFHLKWWMDTNCFALGTSVHPPETNTFLFNGCQSFWMGSSSRTDETTFSWSLVRRPIPAPYQFPRNDGHSFSTEESHKIHSPLLCYDLDLQYNSGLLYQQTRRNTFSQPMVRGMENHPLVPGIRYRDQSGHIPGKFNILADHLLRLDRPLKTEWALDQSIGNSIFQMLSYPDVDLFATRFNHKLPLYVSPDNHALETDALSMNWIHLHAFPPAILIPSVLARIRQSQCRIVLIAPLWPQRLWFSEVLQLLVSVPIHLPLFPKLLTQARENFSIQISHYSLFTLGSYQTIN